MTPSSDWDVVAGYADRLSTRPGEPLKLMTSSRGELELDLIGLPGGTPAPIAARRLREPGPQAVLTGSHVEVPHHEALRPADGLVVSTWIWLAPGAPAGSRRALLASWGEGGADGWALALDREGRPCFELAAGGREQRAVATRALPVDSWWRLEGRFDPGLGELAVSRFDPAGVVVDGSRSDGARAPGPGPGPTTIGAERRGADAPALAHLDGKLERPAIAAGPGGERAVAQWALGEGRAPQVVDRGPLGLHGTCVNGPLRAVTGRHWDGDVHDWRSDPRAYEAMHFHSDAVDDLGWEPSFELEPDGSCPGGLYAARLRAGGCEDVVPFVVRRGAGAPAAHAVLLPSFTYLAYSCEREAPRAAGSRQAEDRWVARNGLRSLYDRYEDGCGAYEASILRPLTQLRPGYRCPQHGGPHGLAQDLLLLGFLARAGIEADLLTDHDLHAEGAAALAGHRVVVTGAHPEYATAELLDALDAHVEAGGRIAYLGGNGFNGRVSVDPARPHVLELRRNETQGLVWQALPGEHHHAATGAYGGDWRRQGRPEHRFLGVGLAAFGEDPARSYTRAPGLEDDPDAEAIFAGLDPEAEIGHPGLVLGGAAGYEVDNHDPLLGSPADAVVLASAEVGEGYSTWPDDVRDTAAAAPKRRADLVLRRPPGGGAVLSAGSIAWTGCLDGDDANPVARVTANALRELARERPFEGPGG